MTTTTETTLAELIEKSEALRLERETCSRCGGSGTYSYCQMYGTRCFKCAGRQEVLTKRGAAANAYLTKLRSKPASELKIGDTILSDGMLSRARWEKVVEIRPGDRDLDGGAIINGEVIPPAIVIETPGCRYHTTPDQMFRVFVSKEHEIETLRQAIAYQATLTKAGQPRKTK
jgi:hypothetical protein